MGTNMLGRAALVVLVAAVGLAPRAAAEDCDVRGVVETPPEGGVITEANVIVSGWAADLAAASGTGVLSVRVSLDADPEQGGIGLPAQSGWERPDVAVLLGSPRYGPSGFALTWDTRGVPPGPHTLHIQVQTACGWTGNTRAVTIAPRPAASGPAVSPASGPGGAPAPGGAAISPASGPAPGGAAAPASAPGGGTVSVPGGAPAAPGARPGTTAPGVTAPTTGAPGVTAPTTGGATGVTGPTTGTAPGVTGPAPGGVPGGAAVPAAPGATPTVPR